MENKEIIELAKAAKDGKIEVVVRHGNALELLPPVPPIKKVGLSLKGDITTVYEFLKKRNHLFIPDECHISVKENSIEFNGNECNDHNSHVTKVEGVLSFTKEIKNFDINNETEFLPKELANYLRKRKNLFSDPEQFRLIWGALSQFEAAIQKKVESSDNKSGNFRENVTQEVVHNIPKTFQLSIQVYENGPQIKFDVEIDISTNLRCSLISFDLDEKIEELRKQLINNELDKEIINGIKLIDFCVVYSC